MRYGSDEGLFMIWLDDITSRCALRLSANEADRLFDALVIYRAGREELVIPDGEPELITGDA